MTAKEILAELKPLGSDSYKKVMANHGVKEPFFGVKISDLQKIQKRIKKDYQLALDLYDTGNYDAMYLAGLIADDARMTKKDLQRWITNATHSPLANSAWSRRSRRARCACVGDVPGDGSPNERSRYQAPEAGWATVPCLVSIRGLPGPAWLNKRLLERVRKPFIRHRRTAATYNELVRHRASHFLREKIPLTPHECLQITDRRSARSPSTWQHLLSGPLRARLHPQVQKRGAIGKRLLFGEMLTAHPGGKLVEAEIPDSPRPPPARSASHSDAGGRIPHPAFS